MILNTYKFSVDSEIIDFDVPRDPKTGLYCFVPIISGPLSRNESANTAIDVSLLHRRFIHASERVIRKSLNDSK